MNPRTAASLLAHRYPDFDSLAAQMGKSPETLRKELTGDPRYKLGLLDVLLMVNLCQAAQVDDALAPVTALAVSVGAMLVPLPMGGGADAKKMAQRLANTAVDFGAFMSTTVQALADDRVTANELKDVERYLMQLVGAGQSCLASMRELHESQMPAYLRGAA